jgi:catalase
MAGPGSHQWQKHEADTDFAQAGDLYRLMDEAAKERLIQSIAGGLGAVTRQDIIDRSVSYFRQADADYGARLEKAIKAVQARIKGEDVSVQIGKPAHDSSNS